jgi:hypothetical protein
MYKTRKYYGDKIRKGGNEARDIKPDLILSVVVHLFIILIIVTPVILASSLLWSTLLCIYHSSSPSPVSSSFLYSCPNILHPHVLQPLNHEDRTKSASFLLSLPHSPSAQGLLYQLLTHLSPCLLFHVFSTTLHPPPPPPPKPTTS